MSEYLNIGDYVDIRESLEGPEKICRIVGGPERVNYDTQDALTAPFVAVLNGASSGYQNLTELQPREDPAELLQLRTGCEDGNDYYIKNPTGTQRHGVWENIEQRAFNARTSPRQGMDEDLEMWLVHSDFPSINAVNETGYANTPRLFFEGVVYNYEKVKNITAEMRTKARIIIRGGVKR